MRVLAVFTLAFVAFAAAERDWSKIFINNRKVDLVDGHPIPQKPSTRITNGNEAVPHSYPWQVGLSLPKWGYGTFCGGSLIDEQNILTAAHCLEDTIWSIGIILGAQYIDGNEPSTLKIFAIDYVIHEHYDSNSLRNDIGLIRLSNPVSFNRYIKPIPVDNSSCSDDYAGREASVSGWGVDSDESTTISPVLREVTLEVISNDECASYYGPDVIQPTVLCTDTSEGKSACSGDSGGALVLDGNQVGVVSFQASAGCEAGYPAAFTRVCQYHRWIELNKKHW